MNLKQSIIKPVLQALWTRKVAGLFDYLRVVREFAVYRRRARGEDVSLRNFFPFPIDRYQSAGEAGMYFYQDTWCANLIKQSAPIRHVDVGSSMMFVAMALQLADLLYVDLRPLAINIPEFSFRRGNLTSLPFESGSIESLSSLSVVEHVGLGRYGDALDPLGTDKACSELARVLKPGGNLYVAVPTAAKASTHFNAHRIFVPESFVAKFLTLKLVNERYGLSDRLVCRCEYERMGMPYAFGCFHFSK
jgi:SAM-dependent methyltransferase